MLKRRLCKSKETTHVCHVGDYDNIESVTLEYMVQWTGTVTRCYGFTR